MISGLPGFIAKPVNLKTMLILMRPGTHTSSGFTQEQTSIPAKAGFCILPEYGDAYKLKDGVVVGG